MVSSQPISSVFQNISDDGKWIIDQFRDLVQIPSSEIPITYHPTTGDSLGVLCEPSSTNYYPHALNMSGGLSSTSGVTLSNTVGVNSILFFPQALRFDGSVKEKSTTFTFQSPQAWFYVGISFFMRFPSDSQPPKYGRSYINGSDFHFLVNGLEAIEASGELKIDRMSDGSYWVRARIKTPSRPVFDITIGNSKWQSDRTFLITGLQIEPYACTSPIITDGSVESRDGNYIRFQGEYNRNINPEQGTIEISYQLNHGSVGSVVTADSSLYSWEIGHIGEWYDNPEEEPTTYVIDVKTPHYDFSNIDDLTNSSIRKWNEIHNIKFTYSGYGNRFVKNNSLVYKQKNFNSNEELLPPEEYFLGISREGTHINGYIRAFNIRGRALTDQEMVNG